MDKISHRISQRESASKAPLKDGVQVPPESLATLYEEYGRRVLAAAYRVTGSTQDAEDVLQTVFLRLTRRWDEIELTDTVGAYLHRAAVNGSLDLLRSRSRGGAIALDDMALAPEQTSEASAERRTRDGEFRRRLRQALLELPEKAARIFALRYFEGLGNTEIAGMLGMRRVSVAVTLHRTRKQLQTKLGQFSEGETS